MEEKIQVGSLDYLGEQSCVTAVTAVWKLRTSAKVLNCYRAAFQLFAFLMWIFLCKSPTKLNASRTILLIS